MTSICVPIVTFNVEYMDYCLEETVRCALQFADEICVNDGMSTDNTYDVLMALQEEFGKDRIKIHRREWVHDWFWQEKERNYALNMSNSDWVFFMDVDECIHENDVPKIRRIAETSKYNFVNCPYYHFYGTPQYIQTHPAFYQRHTKMGRRKTNFRIKAGRRPGGCASEVVSDKAGGSMHLYHKPDMYRSDIYIYHYSWCRDAKVHGVKRVKIESWYRGHEKFFDGYLPTYEECPYKYDMSGIGGNLKPFTGEHPKLMRTWFNKRERLLEWNPGK
jgi:glycosyltransferase involved in cell wall biosynthesis